jgi:hypothetical protein
VERKDRAPFDRTTLSWDRYFSNDNFSADLTLSRSEKAILLVLERAGFLHRLGQKRPKLPWLLAAKSTTEQKASLCHFRTHALQHF